jgi:hypothetical protein
MSPIAITLIVFVCVLGGALLGIFLRTVVPEHQLTESTMDVVKLVTGLIATLAALVLGLLVASAKNSFDAVNEAARDAATKIVLLDRVLAQYGPETKDTRELLRRDFAARVEELFSQDESRREGLKSFEATAAMEGLQQRLRALSPQDEAQRSFKSRALELSDAVAQTRWVMIEHEENTIPTPFLIVLILWLAAMFTSFGLFARRNAVAVAVMFVGALSLSASIFLIEELNNPLKGSMTISRAPLNTALGQLGQ